MPERPMSAVLKIVLALSAFGVMPCNSISAAEKETITIGAPISGSSIRDFLHQVRDYAGASGTITFDKNGDINKPFAIMRIDAGRPKTIVVK
jgi:ABC-type branched-subunit amino acid transport system substrate-binding protein